MGKMWPALKKIGDALAKMFKGVVGEGRTSLHMVERHRSERRWRR